MEETMRSDVRKLLDLIYNTMKGDPRLISEMIYQEAYSTARNSEDDYLGFLLNDLSWITKGVEKAHERDYDSIQLGHEVELAGWQRLEWIETDEGKKLLLTCTWNRPRKTLGVFNDLDEVKQFLHDRGYSQEKKKSNGEVFDY
jgi:hypothetical protein